MTNAKTISKHDWLKIQKYSEDMLGFAEISATDCDLSAYIPHYKKWLDAGYDADLSYMSAHGTKRTDPKELVEGTLGVIVTRLNYLPYSYQIKNWIKETKLKSNNANISCYALGRDYHKVIRQKLKKLSEYINSLYPDFTYRVFTDSAPILEKPLAEKSGLGWIAKNSNIINEKDGSFFFIGVIYCNFDLINLNKKIVPDGCKKCVACIKICPTQAIVENKVIDANKCISYLTIENKGSIPIKYRKAIGNRIYGCDDCQVVCHHNNSSPITEIEDFTPRKQISNKTLIELFNWTKEEFLTKTEGSPIRRIGYDSWIRNIAVALGNSPKNEIILKCLKSALIRFKGKTVVLEHIEWAIKEQT